MYLFKLSSVKLIAITLLFSGSIANSQSQVFGDGPVKWELRKQFEMPPEAEKYSGSDLVILSDFVEFNFYSSTNEKLVRNIRYKINSQKGIEELKHFEMQESFDPAMDEELYKQGRRSRIKTPTIKDYKVKLFAARKFSRQRWANVTAKERYEELRWITPGGEFLNENRMVFDLSTIAIGDVLEIYYEVLFNTNYGANVFYFNNAYPKLKCEYDFVYRVDKSYTDQKFIVPVNLDSAKVYSSKVDYNNHFLVTTKIQLEHLPANNYPLNSLQAKNLPHVFADFSYYRSMVNYTDKNYTFTKGTKPKNYQWLIPLDTSIKSPPKVYDKQFTALKRFSSSLPTSGTEDQNLLFLKALTDSFNNFRYISPNHLFYNESALYEMSSGDHLLKRRLPGNTLWKLYEDLLLENKVFYYLVNIQDKRFGKHDTNQRLHVAYERNLIALPSKKSYVFFNPRFEGLKYYPGELPFYYEGTVAGIIPKNFQPEITNKKARHFKLIQTPKSSYKENSRKEECTIDVLLDSLMIRLTTKEILSGQFSTLLRPLYLNDPIDSTVSPAYFKKCIDKPNASIKKAKPSLRSKAYPFLCSFDCYETIRFKDTSKINLVNWFSFPLSKTLISEKPGCEYFFDFEMEDQYDYSLRFSKAVEIKNKDSFAKKINNDFFELESEITKNSANEYSLKIKLIVKASSIPTENMDLLMDLLKELELLNNFTLEIIRASGA